ADGIRPALSLAPALGWSEGGSIMRRSWVDGALVYFVSVIGLAACGVHDMPDDDGDTGQVMTSMSGMIASGTTFDVTAVALKVVNGGDTCSAPAVASATVPLEGEPFEDSGFPAIPSEHRFAGHLFVLAPGNYRICATPLKADGNPSDVCAATD